MKRNQAQRIEDLSGRLGGRFRLTTLIIKRMREYYTGGRTFMPKLRSHEELFDFVLDQIERGDIVLKKPGELPQGLDNEQESQSEPDVIP